MLYLNNTVNIILPSFCHVEHCSSLQSAVILGDMDSLSDVLLPSTASLIKHKKNTCPVICVMHYSLCQCFTMTFTVTRILLILW